MRTHAMTDASAGVVTSTPSLLHVTPLLKISFQIELSGSPFCRLCVLLGIGIDGHYNNVVYHSNLCLTTDGHCARFNIIDDFKMTRIILVYDDIKEQAKRILAVVGRVRCDYD